MYVCVVCGWPALVGRCVKRVPSRSLWLGVGLGLTHTPLTLTHAHALKQAVHQLPIAGTRRMSVPDRRLRKGSLPVGGVTNVVLGVWACWATPLLPHAGGAWNGWCVQGQGLGVVQGIVGGRWERDACGAPGVGEGTAGSSGVCVCAAGCDGGCAGSDKDGGPPRSPIVIPAAGKSVCVCVHMGGPGPLPYPVHWPRTTPSSPAPPRLPHRMGPGCRCVYVTARWAWCVCV
jgi:hypothetical protein